MSPQPDQRQPVRHVQLPSGKTIEVVYFEGPRVGERTAELEVCGTCAGELVYPVDWVEAGNEHWRVTLRCPSCEWSGTGVFTQDEVERFDKLLDRATEIMVRDLNRLVSANMEQEIEGFALALRDDHLLPSDF